MKNHSDGIIYLDAFVLDDALALVKADQDAEHRLRFEFPEGFCPSIQHSQRVIERWNRQVSIGTHLILAARSERTGELVGGCEIRFKDGNLSYWTLPEHRRRGIATRIVSLACRFACSREISCLQILIDVDNAGSRKAATNNRFEESGRRDGRVSYSYFPGKSESAHRDGD
jgi:RimJ/RimL family protein N-acetyltransferase